MDNYDIEEELESEPTLAVLVPAPQLAGQPFTLVVEDTEEVAAPFSLPLTMLDKYFPEKTVIESPDICHSHIN